MECNTCKRTNAQIVWVGATAAPHAVLGFYWGTVLPSRGTHSKTLLKSSTGLAAGHEKSFQYPFLRDDATLQFGRQYGLSCHATALENAWSHHPPCTFALIGFLRNQRLPSLMAKQEFLPMPRLARYG